MNNIDIGFPTDFDTKQHPVLYHYCTTDTLLAIMQNKCLWMSDINTMNDFGEVHWAYEQFITAANQVIDDVGEDFIAKLDKVVSSTQLYTLPVVTSLSTEGDVLSQWRAYANDGAGVSIGFDSEKISRLSVRIGQICYDVVDQVSHFRTSILAFHDVYSRLPEDEKRQFLLEVGGQFGVNLALFKNPAFSEEKEVRLIRALTVVKEAGSWALKDVGGTGEKTSRKILDVNYRAAPSGGLISYIALPLKGLGMELISEIIIGPKNPCAGPEIAMALNANNLKGVAIKKSASTYR